jgi:hypothetical protein
MNYLRDILASPLDDESLLVVLNSIGKEYSPTIEDMNIAALYGSLETLKWLREWMPFE